MALSLRVGARVVRQAFASGWHCPRGRKFLSRFIWRRVITLLTAKEIFDLVREDLVLVEAELSRQSEVAFAPVAELTSYLLGGGGKRLRPALLLLCNGYAAGKRSPGAIRLAAVVELLHSATLIHDDVIDASDTRRGRPSANSRWGNHRSVLAGDWLYMQSFQMALEERNFRILDVLIDLTQKMVEGELLQLAKIGRIDVTEDEALQSGHVQDGFACSAGSRLGLARCLAVWKAWKKKRWRNTDAMRG